MQKLEPLGEYDPYRPRVYGTEKQIEDRKRVREVIDMVMTNEAFAIEQQHKIAARTRAIAEQDAISLENSLKVEAEARKHKVTR